MKLVVKLSVDTACFGVQMRAIFVRPVVFDFGLLKNGAVELLVVTDWGGVRRNRPGQGKSPKRQGLYSYPCRARAVTVPGRESAELSERASAVCVHTDDVSDIRGMLL